MITKIDSCVFTDVHMVILMLIDLLIQDIMLYGCSLKLFKSEGKFY